ncbi:hypothetical protein LPB140_11065 [Sphingorhabdus lutea]|uniref:Bacteriophage phiJL001 Gp84 C-terminal domain-containing protein n=1 Tax=Sphingorhabdus lutea TaxID=1913578 RepID=A0A1L3JFA5_9SPHN|nr:DUF2163 domain-containing protein [Sphingorhabdus lutea]APG63812.1 hypothetical protein LPB140_11065 [Sphingorhabdus lutea]
MDNQHDENLSSAPPLTSFCYIWQILRHDGIMLAFTSHDRNVAINGIDYHASSGLIPTSIDAALGLENNGPDVDGILSNNAITDADIRAGKWDYAQIKLAIADWDKKTIIDDEMSIYHMGAIRHDGHHFTAELEGISAALLYPIIPKTSPTCRARLGDAKCGINLNKYRCRAHIEKIEGERIFITPAVQLTPHYLAHGSIKFLSGRSCGHKSAIWDNDVNSVKIVDMPYASAQVGDMILLTQGCPKSISACGDRFENAQNFRGEPFLPGNDLLTRYPNAI